MTIGRDIATRTSIIDYFIYIFLKHSALFIIIIIIIFLYNMCHEMLSQDDLD